MASQTTGPTTHPASLDVVGRILAARRVLDGARGPAPDFMYATRAAWLDLGGNPATFDALPSVDLGDDHG